MSLLSNSLLESPSRSELDVDPCLLLLHGNIVFLCLLDNLPLIYEDRFNALKVPRNYLAVCFLVCFVRCIFAGIANVTVNIMKLRKPDCKLRSLFFDLLRVGTSFIKSAGELITRGGTLYFVSVTVRGLCCLFFVFGITVLFF